MQIKRPAPAPPLVPHSEPAATAKEHVGPPTTPMDVKKAEDVQSGGSLPDIDLISTSVLTLQPGHRLFHGTMEPLEGGMQTGIDGCLWLAEDRVIARCYIPSSGIVGYVALSSLMRVPDKGSCAADLQKSLGFEFTGIDYQGGFQPQSYRMPTLVDDLMSDRPWPDRSDYPDDDTYYDKRFEREREQKKRFGSYIQGKLAELGYEAESPSVDPSYRLKLKIVDGHDVILPNQNQPGTLLEFTPSRPLVIFDMTDGGTREGDLTDLDYHKISVFRELREQGYDGVKINDFAQVDGHGNMGHTSIGIFRSSLPALSEVGRQPSTHPVDIWGELQEERRQAVAAASPVAIFEPESRQPMGALDSDLWVLENQARDPRVRQAAFEALEAMGPGALEVTASLAQDANEDIREYAARSLGKMGPGAIPVLVKLAKDPCEPVADFACESLEDMGPEAIRALADLAERGYLASRPSLLQEFKHVDHEDVPAPVLLSEPVVPEVKKPSPESIIDRIASEEIRKCGSLYELYVGRFSARVQAMIECASLDDQPGLRAAALKHADFVEGGTEWQYDLENNERL